MILGAGIGRALIRLLEPFDARVLAVTRSGREVPGAAESYAAEETSELWPEGDYFVVAAPATAATGKMIGARELEAMQEHAWVVDRGARLPIDTDALVEALAAGSIGGAARRDRSGAAPRGAPAVDRAAGPITPHSANPPDALVRRSPSASKRTCPGFMAGEELIGVIDVEAGY